MRLNAEIRFCYGLPAAWSKRVDRVVTRIYDQELRKAGLEITQFGLLTALAATGEANQKRLSAGFAMDSTTLTRTLGLLLKQGWVRVSRGRDRRVVQTFIEIAKEEVADVFAATGASPLAVI
jgi:DNA-binding MarR family transcriptional regulator